MATLKDVAELAGTSVTTVSRMLNNRGYISQSLSEQIRAAMEELQYQPNEVARSLSKQSTGIIGVLLPLIDNPFFSEVASELERVLTANGYKMMLYSAKDRQDHSITANNYIEMLRGNRVDGVVMALRKAVLDVKSIHEELPIVSFEQVIGGKIPAVSCDNYRGGVLAVEELEACGCKRLGFVNILTRESFPAADRETGFRKACCASGLESRLFIVPEEYYINDDFREPIREILQANPDIDGYFCTSDELAACVLQQAALLGRRVPEEIKVVGFNDNRIARQLTPTLTSVRQQVPLMCETAIDILLARRRGEAVPLNTVVPVQMTCRASTRGSAAYEKEEIRE